MIQSKRPNRRSAVLSAAALTVATSILLVGCSRPETSESASPGAPIDDAKATGDVTIWADSTDGDALQVLADAFEGENPDAHVTVTVIPYDDYVTKITTAISGGSTPDMALLGSQSLPRFFASGAFEPVPEGLVDTSSFYDGANEAAEYDGVATAVPLYVETRPFLYRSDLATAAGVEAPVTWDDYIPFAKALEGAGAKKGMRVETGEEGSTSIIMTDLIWQAGGELLNDDATKWTLDTPEALEAFTLYNSFFTEDVAPNPGPEWGTIDAGFVAGDFGSFITGAWSIGFSDDAGGTGWAAKNVGVTTLPTGPGGNAASVLDGKGWAVFDEAKNSDAAWKFARYMSDPQTQADWYSASSTLPANQAAWDLPELQADPLLAGFDAQLMVARATPAVTTWSEIQVELQAAAERVSSGSMTPAESLAELQSRADSIGVGE